MDQQQKWFRIKKIHKTTTKQIDDDFDYSFKDFSVGDIILVKEFVDRYEIFYEGSKYTFEWIDNLELEEADIGKVMSDLLNYTPPESKSIEGDYTESTQLVVRNRMTTLTTEVKERQLATKRAASKMQDIASAIKWSLQDQVKSMNKMVHRCQQMSLAIDLFVGNYDTIEVQTGEPASIETPITIRQMFLYADECACFEKIDLDFEDMSIFDDWLKKNYKTALPEQKCIVGVRPRKTPKDYKDPWEAMGKQHFNFYSHLIIRNGENVYRIPLPYMIGSELVMSKESFIGKFDDHKGEPIKPGSRAYGKAIEASEDKTRHQMITVLLLQGLVDNQTIFEPLAPNSVNFLDARTVNIFMEKEIALPDLTDDFEKWQRDNLKNVGVGMRIVGNFNQYAWHDEYREDDPLVHPPNAPRPKSSEVYTIKSREYDYYGEEFLKFTYKRTDEVWKGRYDGGYQEASSYASFKVPIRRQIPIICADTCTIEDVKKYMNSKSGKENYKEMVPLLKILLEYLTDKKEKEQPVRENINKELRKVALPHDFVGFWLNVAIKLWQRRQRKWRDIFDNAEKSTKEISEWIIKMFGLMQQSQFKDVDLIGKELKKLHPKAIWIGLDVTGKLNVMEPESKNGSVWLVWNQYQKNKNNEYRNTKQNQLTLYKPVFGGMYTINSEEQWDDWIKDAKEKDVINPAEALKLAEKYLAVHCEIKNRKSRHTIVVNNQYVESDSPVTLHPEITREMKIERSRFQHDEDGAIVLPLIVTIDSKYQKLSLWVASAAKHQTSPFGSHRSEDWGKLIQFRFKKSKDGKWLLFYKSTHCPEWNKQSWTESSKNDLIIKSYPENIEIIDKHVQKGTTKKEKFRELHNKFDDEFEACVEKYSELIISHHRTKFVLNYKDLELFDEYLKDLGIEPKPRCYIGELSDSFTWLAWKKIDPSEFTILEILEKGSEGLGKMKTSDRNHFIVEEVKAGIENNYKEGFEAFLKLKLSEIYNKKD